MKMMKKNNKIISRQEIRFVIIFSLLITTFYVIYYLSLDNLAFLKNYIAVLLSLTLNILGIDATAKGEDVFLKGFSLKIVEECTAAFASLIYISCVLAYPSNLKSKLMGIGFGITVIQIINLGRLVILSFTGLYYPDIFEYVHTYIWQSVFIVFVIVVWLVWLERFAG